MPFHLIPPPGVEIDVTKGERVAEDVFVANKTAPEIAIFGLQVAQRYAAKRRCDPPTEEEQRLCNVFGLAWSSALEATTGSQTADGWTYSVTTPDDVFLWVPGASVEAIRRGTEAAREVFHTAGIAPQEAALGQYEQTVYDIRGFERPEPSVESARAASLFHEAERAAFVACRVEASGRYLLIEGYDTPYWLERCAKSPVLSWQPEETEVA
jgi:hypothetical protein